MASTDTMLDTIRLLSFGKQLLVLVLELLSFKVTFSFRPRQEGSTRQALQISSGLSSSLYDKFMLS